MADLNKLIGAALKCSADTLCDDKDSTCMFDGIVRKNVDYFVKCVIDIFNESCNGVYRIEQFSAWHGPDRLVDEDCQRSYAINLKTLTPIDNVLVIKPGEINKYKNYKGTKLYYEPDHYCYGDDEYGVTYMISLDDVYVHYYPLLDKIEIVCERLGGTSIEFNSINVPTKEFIRKVENLIPVVEKFSKQLF